jgi:hypothetical protein
VDLDVDVEGAAGLDLWGEDVRGGSWELEGGIERKAGREGRWVYSEVEGNFGLDLVGCHFGEETGFFVCGELVCQSRGVDTRGEGSQQAEEQKRMPHRGGKVGSQSVLVVN